MTPLAHRLVRWSLDPKMKEGEHWATPGLRDWVIEHLTDDVLYFEITEALPLTLELSNRFIEQWTKKQQIDDTLAFLPGPKVWIEFESGGFRSAFFMMQDDTADSGAWMLIFMSPHASRRTPPCPCCGEDLVGGPNFDKTTGASGLWREYMLLQGASPEQLAQTMPGGVGFDGQKIDGENAGPPTQWAILSILNSPHVIEQVEHRPHKGTARALRNAGRPYQLKPWRQVKLSINEELSKSVADPDFAGRPHHGNVALHFVRKHIRVRLGKLELVKRHKRGDPAVGIARSYFKVVP